MQNYDIKLPTRESLLLYFSIFCDLIDQLLLILLNIRYLNISSASLTVDIEGSGSAR